MLTAYFDPLRRFELIATSVALSSQTSRNEMPFKDTSVLLPLSAGTFLHSQERKVTFGAVSTDICACWETSFQSNCGCIDKCSAMTDPQLASIIARANLAALGYLGRFIDLALDDVRQAAQATHSLVHRAASMKSVRL